MFYQFSVQDDWPLVNEFVDGWQDSRREENLTEMVKVCILKAGNAFS